jgi:hypothetical protein
MVTTRDPNLKQALLPVLLRVVARINVLRSVSSVNTMDAKRRTLNLRGLRST